MSPYQCRFEAKKEILKQALPLFIATPFVLILGGLGWILVVSVIRFLVEHWILAAIATSVLLAPAAMGLAFLYFLDRIYPSKPHGRERWW